ncbi:MAG: FAD:protein FMN transferase [Coriobacteriia bacterium]
MRRLILICLVVATALMTACARPREPLRESREALGTFVGVTAYVPLRADENAGRQAVDEAYAMMAAIEDELDAHDKNSAIVRAQAPETGALPADATAILDAIERLGVGAAFSPHLYDVVTLYDFEGGGRIPSDIELAEALDSRNYDLGGATKGLALDKAVASLGDSWAIEAALVTAGSTTVTFGLKPNGEPWRIAIEDPRDPDEQIGTIEARGHACVSTSGDYQRYFERDGVRYHHILDPATGQPARGLQSLTVVGTETGLESDILSTALFVMGRDDATAYAREHGLGLVLVDDEGRVHVVPGPDDVPWTIEIQ